MYATDKRHIDRRQTDVRQTKASLNVSALWGGGIKALIIKVLQSIAGIDAF